MEDLSFDQITFYPSTILAKIRQILRQKENRLLQRKKAWPPLASHRRQPCFFPVQILLQLFQRFVGAYKHQNTFFFQRYIRVGGDLHAVPILDPDHIQLMCPSQIQLL